MTALTFSLPIICVPLRTRGLLPRKDNLLALSQCLHIVWPSKLAQRLLKLAPFITVMFRGKHWLILVTNTSDEDIFCDRFCPWFVQMPPSFFHGEGIVEIGLFESQRRQLCFFSEFTRGSLQEVFALFGASRYSLPEASSVWNSPK